MSKSLKFNNKVKIVLFLLRGMIFILVVVGFFALVQKIKADTSLYDFYSGAGIDRWAYKKEGSQPTSPTDGDLVETSDYSNISISDNNRWETFLGTGGLWNSQVYTFEIAENISSITELVLEWEGYGETCNGYITYFYIWKVNTLEWELLDSRDYTSSVDFTLGTTTSNFADYIDSSNNNKLTIMSTSQELSALGESCSGDSECCSGHCADEVCCDSLCGGDCEYCNSEGICTIRGLNDNTEITIDCYYCDGTNSNSQAYSGDNGVNCNDDCTYCNNGSCDDRDAGATDECTGCQECNVAGGDCIDKDDNCSACHYCSSGSCIAQISQDTGNKCIDDCTWCDASASCADRDAGATDECTGCQECNVAGGDCIDKDDNCSACHYCSSGSCIAQISQDTGNKCIDDCTWCDASASCADRDAGATDECVTCQACNRGGGVGGDCTPITAANGKNCNDDCTYCNNGACVNRALEDDTECPTCKACNGGGDCSDVLTETTNTDTGWGFNLWGCIGANKRCYKGVCRTCSAPTGYIASDGFEGCVNCSNQGGKACWRLAPLNTSCTTYCNQGFGGCVDANWNDSTNCDAARNFWTCDNCFSGVLKSNPSVFFTTCYHRSWSVTQGCTDLWATEQRLCVCQY